MFKTGHNILGKTFIVSLVVHLGVLMLAPEFKEHIRPSGEEDTEFELSIRLVKRETKTVEKTKMEEPNESFDAAEALKALEATKVAPILAHTVPVRQMKGSGAPAAPTAARQKHRGFLFTNWSDGAKEISARPTSGDTSIPMLASAGLAGTFRGISLRPRTIIVADISRGQNKERPKAAGSATWRPELRSSLAKPKLTNRPPAYPTQARRKGWEGKVVLEISVLSSGRVDEIAVQESSGHSILDTAALRTVRRWRFVPAHRDGEYINSTVRLPVIFQLQ